MLDDRPSGTKPRDAKGLGAQSKEYSWAVCPRIAAGHMYRRDEVARSIGFDSKEEGIQWLHGTAEPKVKREHVRGDGSIEEYYATREDSWCGPLPVKAISDYPGPPHAGRKLRDVLKPEYYGAIGRISSGNLLPRKCFLGSDWQVEMVFRGVLERPGHWIEGRKFDSLLRPIATALGDLEDVLLAVHPTLSTDALNAFWNSYQFSHWLQQFCETVLAREPSAKEFAESALESEPVTRARFLVSGMVSLEAALDKDEFELTAEPWLLPIQEAMLVMELHTARYANSIVGQDPRNLTVDELSESRQNGAETSRQAGRDEGTTVEKSTLWRIVSSAMYRKNWSIEDLGRQADVDRATLYRIRRGSTSPHPKTVAKLANALALTDEERRALDLY